ncbi:MAG: hypothetical protein JOY93_04165 [Acidobacteriales bacterium]|nr:hypothetical protein [Terriglobales bacterium]
MVGVGKSGTALRIIALTILAVSASAKEKSPLQALRWSEGAPGCSFTRDEDGKYRYQLQSNEFVVTVAVDSQELAKSRRRPAPIFGVFITVRYLGPQFLDVSANRASLEFLKHGGVVQSSLDPDDLSSRLQTDLDTLGAETEREARKHPEKRHEQETLQQAHLKDTTELIEFLGTHSLPSVRLDPANQETSGWVFFSTRNRWIGSWKTQEDFVLRIPLGDKIVEFPFKLPPKPGDLILRQRPD